ncbi:HDOD domain-containing protein [Chitinimonas sp.]|uniref:HDOD domain-containing protein n=1 Tax=Chitinimonas sp. TaxID=1934313 RepID=UPI002F95FBA9
MAVQLSEEEAAKLLKSLTLPPLPQVMSELQAAQARGEDNATLAEIVGQDLSLSAAVLKTANSPAFAGRRFDTLQDAVLYLGSANLGSVVSGVALKHSIPLPPILGMFWDEATRIAAIAALLARHWKLARPEQAYLFCLFRDSGIPVLAQRFPSYISTLARAMAQPARFIEVELKSRTCSHVIVGYLLARSWYLPEAFNLAILHHHDYADLHDRGLLGEESARLVALARLAEYLMHTRQTGERDEHWPELEDSLLAILGQDKAALREASELVEPSET